MGKIFMIIGKTATGKDHIYQKLLNERRLELEPIILHTTRPRRPGEADGKQYYFSDEEQMNKLRLFGKIIEERAYDTVFGKWYYFLADEGQINPEEKDYLTIGTLQSFRQIGRYFGQDKVVPIYIASDPYLRLQRYLHREHKQKNPEYKEVCRRFLADEEDFSPEKLKAARIKKTFSNDEKLENCIEEVSKYILSFKQNN